jgi:hypothetical protein
VLIYPDHPPLEHRIEAFDRICVVRPTPVLTHAVPHIIVLGEVLVEVGISAGLIGHIGMRTATWR